jgi:hypothetical protein
MMMALTAALVLLTLPLLVFDVWRKYQTVTRLLFFFLWFRFVLSAFHDVTFVPRFGGLSINALASIAMTGLGLAVLNLRFLTLKNLLPIYMFLAVVLISGLGNKTFIDLFNVLIKWLFFIMMTLHFMLAFRTYKLSDILVTIQIVFILPLSSQFLSVALGAGKATESDGSTSFIGAYNHEAAFSVMMLILIFSSVLIEERPKLRNFGSVIIGIASIILANYRTAMLCALPLVAGYGLRQPAALFYKSQRWIIVVVALLFVGTLGTVVGTLMAERFADIGYVVVNLELLTQHPNDFTSEEQDLFSARIYLWSQYIYGYLEGSQFQIFFGQGPESWSGIFSTYAHNTFISYIYEFGPVGLIAITIVMGAGFVQAMTAREAWAPSKIIAAHIGFFILNLATMPFWQIEGLMLYALIMGYTWAAQPRLSFIGFQR